MKQFKEVCTNLKLGVSGGFDSLVSFKLFISNLDQVTKLSFLAGGLELPFDKRTVETSRRYTAVSVHKIFGTRARMIADSTNKK